MHHRRVGEVDLHRDSTDGVLHSGGGLSAHFNSVHAGLFWGLDVLVETDQKVGGNKSEDLICLVAEENETLL